MTGRRSLVRLVLFACGFGLAGLATVAHAAPPACNVSWTGNAGNGQWSTAANWSTNRVPGPTSDVCIETLSTVDATPPISVHSIQVGVGASLLFGSGNVAVATSVTNQGFITLTGTALSTASIDNSPTGDITAYNNSSIASPAFSNTSNVTVGTGGTLTLADNPIQLANGNLSGGGTWLDYGVLVLPGDITQITGQGTVLAVDGVGSAVRDAAGHNALATLTSVGSGVAFDVVDGASLTIAQGLTTQGVVGVGSGPGGSLTVNGTFTEESGGGTGLGGGTLTATSITVQSGASLGGYGTVATSVTNNGTMGPNGLTVTGNYTQTAGGAMSQQFGSFPLTVKGTTTLSGALTVTINPKHPPQPGASYTALVFSTLAGSFTSHTTGFTLTTGTNSIKVTKQ